MLRSRHQSTQSTKETPSSSLNVDPATFVVKFDLNRWAQCTPITTYILALCSPQTKTWWVLRKRFSECYAIRQQLVHLPGVTQPVASMIRPMSLLKFPRRKIQGDNDEIKAERAAGLQTFTAALARMRQECMALAMSRVDTDVLEQVDLLYSVLTTFLHVPLLQIQEEVRQVVSTTVAGSHRLCTSRSDDECTNGHVECSICLEDMAGDGRLVQLTCGHTFHKNCVGGWTKCHFTCPLCRTASYDESYLISCTVHAILSDETGTFLARLRRCQATFDHVGQSPGILLDGPRLMERSPVLDSVCSVCLEGLDDSSQHRQLHCGHGFHPACIVKWLSSHKTCPVCRAEGCHGYMGS
ncbi:hypothetical protein DYB37_007865 [Aphanomyces astaci]|uniref:RING-type E3 ubiquitin transferase n=2 Tax=Aphanomyces astaci TaxID=112090 RepID=A0A3R7AAZ0_APHAT|nr:hypothetical protein DYB26_004984 [Aphanomyces astaci]RHY97680.1 hypothetical protein DYB35_005615 [Aphanomyces astaci]RHZ27387.1 hypothetical protein DYB37_007865 [Aphanomyces astaci]